MPAFEFVVLFLVAFFLAAAFTPLARSLARRLGLVDVPDGGRKRHRKAIPLAGGYAILPAFILPLVLFILFPGVFHADTVPANTADRLGLLGAGALIALFMGAMDDKYDLRARWKLVFQVVAALFAYAGGCRISILSNPFGGGNLSLGILALPVTLFWFLGCMNAINLVDGMDGLAAGVALFATLTGLVVALSHGNVLAAILCVALLGAISGFLLYNFPPASVFLGDAGSMVLGFLVAALSLLDSTKAGTAVGLLVPLLALGLPVFDTALAIIRRVGRGLPIACPDRRHIHHVLLRMGLDQRTAVVILYGACAFLGLLALATTLQRGPITAMVLLVLCGIAVLVIRRLPILDLGQVVHHLRSGLTRHSRQSRAAIETERFLLGLDNVSDLAALWTAAFPVFESLDIDGAVLHLRRNGSPARRYRWTRADSDPEDPSPAAAESAEEDSGDRWHAEFALRNEAHLIGILDVWGRLAACPVMDSALYVGRVRDGFLERSDLFSPASRESHASSRVHPSPSTAPAASSVSGLPKPAL